MRVRLNEREMIYGCALTGTAKRKLLSFLMVDDRGSKEV